MSNFATMLKDENNKAKTLTENFAVAYETNCMGIYEIAEEDETAKSIFEKIGLIELEE